MDGFSAFVITVTFLSTMDSTANHCSLDSDNTLTQTFYQNTVHTHCISLWHLINSSYKNDEIDNLEYFPYLQIKFTLQFGKKLNSSQNTNSDIIN